MKWKGRRPSQNVQDRRGQSLRAANAIGDDAIQGKTRGEPLPHTFTHGTSEQRMRWFKRGLESGLLDGGDTFSLPYQQL